MTGGELRARLAAGGPAYGVWSTLDGVLAPEVAALAGADWACIDFQHGGASLDAAAPAFQAIAAAGVVPLARVIANDHWVIGRTLDIGAAGVIVPMIDGPEGALRAVQAVRYPPAGARSYGPVWASANAGEPLCIVMCETRGGADTLGEICAVPGVDAIYIGPRDLSLSHGLEPGPELDHVIDRIRATCTQAGMPVGIHTASGARARSYVEAGFRFAGVCTDRDVLARAAAAELEVARGAPAAPA